MFPTDVVAVVVVVAVVGTSSFRTSILHFKLWTLNFQVSSDA
jgi:hypothetical protein